jgi:hypothetical protein
MGSLKATALALVVIAGFFYWVPTAHAQSPEELEELAAKGELLTTDDERAAALRDGQNPWGFRGFYIGMAAAESDTEPGPGKQAIRNSLPLREQLGFDTAVSYSLARNKCAVLAAKGELLVADDELATMLRDGQSPTGRRGFDIGMAAAETDTEQGAGKQAIRNTLPLDEQPAFDAAVLFSLTRNKNSALVANGAAIAAADAELAELRGSGTDAWFLLGFDMATGVFGDPLQGALGNTATGPGSLAIRNSLTPMGQQGFDASVKLHLSRTYARPAAPVVAPKMPDNQAEASDENPLAGQPSK